MHMYIKYNSLLYICVYCILDITITAMDVRIVGSILVISWEYIKAGLEDTDVNITVSFCSKLQGCTIRCTGCSYIIIIYVYT